MRLDNQNLLKNMISFIEGVYGSFSPIIINEKTRIEEDLGITGDEACEFILNYGKTFNVDVSNFLVANYFKPEGYDFLSPILEALGLKKKTIKKVLTIGDLLKGIKAKKLDEEVLDIYFTLKK